MRTEDFDYSLPPEFIAQKPARPRDSSRLMVLDRSSGEIRHRNFHQLPDLLRPGDALVLNETRVLPVRLNVHKAETGGRVELLLLKQESPTLWIALVGGKGLRPGRRLQITGGLIATVEEDLGGPRRRIRFEQPIDELLDEIGSMPVPPYITEPLEDPEEYQTVFAELPGSAAAPTAGLHFTPDLLQRLKEKGILTEYVTLHVGWDTFGPVQVQDPTSHPIHSEWCQVQPDVAARLNDWREAGGRVVAVGTTCVRTLETASRQKAEAGLAPFSGPTDLFILPGFQFRAVDAMITNFHLPRSTLLMLVSAFAGRQRIMSAYELAKREGYRFYSFGDAMLIL